MPSFLATGKCFKNVNGYKKVPKGRKHGVCQAEAEREIIIQLNDDKGAKSDLEKEGDDEDSTNCLYLT